MTKDHLQRCQYLYFKQSYMSTQYLNPSEQSSSGDNHFLNLLVKSAESGVAGATAMSAHVLCLMWMKTTMNYQYRHGGGFANTVSLLFHQPDAFRLYRGIIPALLIGPLYRFGDIAANMIAIDASKQSMQLRKHPIFVQTFFGSFLAGVWRTLLLPINSWKTSKQVHGKDGLKIFLGKTKAHGFSSLYHGAGAEFVSTWAAHYSWFVVHNYLEDWLPKYSYKDQLSSAVIQSAAIGFYSTLISDCLVNSLRILKAFKQTAQQNLSYKEIISSIIKQDGISGIFLRGLLTKVMINSFQGISFSVSWKYMEYKLSGQKQTKN